MSVSRAQIIATKCKLAKSLLAKAAEWRNPEYLAFVDEDRRRARILSLTLRARELKREVRQLARYRGGT